MLIWTVDEGVKSICQALQSEVLPEHIHQPVSDLERCANPDVPQLLPALLCLQN